MRALNSRYNTSQVVSVIYTAVYYNTVAECKYTRLGKYASTYGVILSYIHLGITLVSNMGGTYLSESPCGNTRRVYTQV